MPREKQGYRDTIEDLNRVFPDVGMLSRKQVAQYMGVHMNTVYNRINFKGMPRITKSDFARQICG